MRRAAGRLLLAGGLLAFLGSVGAAALGLAPFAPFWAFLSSAAAMAGLALRQPDPEDAGRGPTPGLDGALSEGGGTGAGDAGGDGGTA